MTSNQNFILRSDLELVIKFKAFYRNKVITNVKCHKALTKTQIPLMIRNLMRQKNHSSCLMNSFCNRRIQNYVYISVLLWKTNTSDWVTQVKKYSILWSKETLENLIFRTKKITTTPALQVPVWSMKRHQLLFRISKKSNSEKSSE